MKIDVCSLASPTLFFDMMYQMHSYEITSEINDLNLDL